MSKLSALMAAGILVASAGLALAQNNNQMPNGQQRPPATSGQSGAGQMDPNRGTGMTGAPSTTNPQGGGGLQQPRQPAREWRGAHDADQSAPIGLHKIAAVPLFGSGIVAGWKNPNAG